MFSLEDFLKSFKPLAECRQWKLSQETIVAIWQQCKGFEPETVKELCRMFMVAEGYQSPSDFLAECKQARKNQLASERQVFRALPGSNVEVQQPICDEALKFRKFGRIMRQVKAAESGADLQVICRQVFAEPLTAEERAELLNVDAGIAIADAIGFKTPPAEEEEDVIWVER